MIHITPAAQQYFIKLLKKQTPGTQIRVFIVNPGTAIAECGISYCPRSTIEDTDIKLDFKKFQVYVDQISLDYLKEAEIDLSMNNLDSQIILKAPHAKINHLSHNEPLNKLVQNLIKTQINPQLAIHGGYVTLVTITPEKFVILKFSGGCNGCSMANITLKESIEKKLMNYFPEIKGVQDITNHQAGNHSYYK